MRTASQVDLGNWGGGVAGGRRYAVEAFDLTKEYPLPTSFFSRRGGGVKRSIVAVDRVSLQLEEGETFGLVGPNGAGKTTLIKMLTTLLAPTAGAGRIAGCDIVADDLKVRRLVGLVTSNERSFYWRLTGRQNLDFFVDLYRLPPRETGRWIDELLERVGLRDKIDERFDGYSTGMRQRLALARGVLHKPKILFMDEPTKGVDPIGATEIIDMIRGRIWDSWRPTICITSHNLTEIERLCGRIALMHGGRIIASGSLDELRGLVQPADLYRMTIRNLEIRQLTVMAATAKATAPAEITKCNGALNAQVRFQPDSGGLAVLIRAVIEAGGDVMDCTAVKESFEDVFAKLMEKPAGREACPAIESGQ